MSIGQRIRSERLALNLTQPELAKLVGCSKGNISLWENDQTAPRGSNLLKLAEIFRMAPGDLLSGENKKNGLTSNAREFDRPIGRIPLISWVSAGTWCESPDEFAPGDAEQWLPLPDSAGPRSYALRVEGDSMTAPYPGVRSYPHGTIIYVDPDRSVTNGCRVVARTPEGEYTFKTYSEDAGRKYLKPINPQYPTVDITGHMHICGVVIGSYLPE